MVSLIEEGGGGEGELEEEGLEFEITGFVPVDPNRSELEKNKKKREEERKKEGPEYWSEERKKNNRSPTIIVVVSKEEKEEGERMKKRVGGGFGEKFREFCESDKLLDATILSSKDEMDAFLTHFYPLCVDCSAMLTSVVALAKHEVEITENLSLLFRRDSPASKLLRRFNTEVGKDYTDNILLDFFDHAEHSYLPDLSLNTITPPPSPSAPPSPSLSTSIPAPPSPSSSSSSSPSLPLSSSSSPSFSSPSLPSPREAKESEEIIECAFRFLLWLIEESVQNIPIPMRYLSREVGGMVGKKFGEGGKRTFGVGYFFLRFLCPALACPENVQGPVGGEMKKFCILLSKLIQMAASGRRTEGRGMEFTNNFLKEGEKAIEKVVSFLFEEDEGEEGEKKKSPEEVMEQWRKEKGVGGGGGRGGWTGTEMTEKTEDFDDLLSEKEEGEGEWGVSSEKRGGRREGRKKGLFEEQGRETETEMTETDKGESEMEWSLMGDGGGGGRGWGGGGERVEEGAVWVYVDSIAYFYDFFNRKKGEIRRNYLRERERERRLFGGGGKGGEGKEGKEKEEGRDEQEENVKKNGKEEEKEKEEKEEKEEKVEKVEKVEKIDETTGEKEGEEKGKRRLSRRLSFTTTQKIQKKSKIIEEKEKEKEKEKQEKIEQEKREEGGGEGEEEGDVGEVMELVRWLHVFFGNSLIEPEDLSYDPSLQQSLMKYSSSTHMYSWLKLWLSLMTFEHEKSDRRRKDLFMAIKKDHFQDRAPFHVSLTPNLVNFFEEEEESLHFYTTNLLLNIKPEVRSIIKTMIIPAYLSDIREKVEKGRGVEGEGGGEGEEGDEEGKKMKRRLVLSKKIFSPKTRDYEGGGGERMGGGGSEPLMGKLSSGGGGMAVKRGVSDFSVNLSSSGGSSDRSYSARGLKPSLLPHFIHDLMQIEGIMVRNYAKDRTIERGF